MYTLLLHMHMFWDILPVFKFHIVYINMCSIVHLQKLVQLFKYITFVSHSHFGTGACHWCFWVVVCFEEHSTWHVSCLSVSSNLHQVAISCLKKWMFVNIFQMNIHSQLYYNYSTFHSSKLYKNVPKNLQLLNT
jgi:hypothetical protein